MNSSAVQQLKHDLLFTPPPMIPSFLRDRVIDSRICPKNPSITYFAWITNDRNVEINTYDDRSKAPWMKTAECEDCYLALHSTVRERGFRGKVYSPALCSDEYIPPAAPFLKKQLLETSRCQTAPILNFAWFRSDRKIATDSFNIETRHWMNEMDQQSYERIKMSVRAKGYENEFVLDCADPWLAAFGVKSSGRMQSVPKMNKEEETPVEQPLPMPDIQCQEVEEDPEEEDSEEAQSEVSEPHPSSLEVPNKQFWVPTISQMEQVRRYAETLVCYDEMSEATKRIRSIARDITLLNARTFTEQELETTDFDPLCLDDAFEARTAVLTLVTCSIDFEPTDSYQEKYDKMIRTAEETVEKQFAKEMRKEEEESQEDQEEDPPLADASDQAISSVETSRASSPESLPAPVAPEAVKPPKEHVLSRELREYVGIYSDWESESEETEDDDDDF